MPQLWAKSRIGQLIMLHSVNEVKGFCIENILHTASKSHAAVVSHVCTMSYYTIGEVVHISYRLS